MSKEIICLPEGLDTRTLSHELRTSLVPILGISHQLLEREELTPEIKNSISYIFEAGNRLLDLANEITKIIKLATNASLNNDELHELASVLVQQIQDKESNKPKAQNYRMFS